MTDHDPAGAAGFQVERPPRAGQTPRRGGDESGVGTVGKSSAAPPVPARPPAPGDRLSDAELRSLWAAAHEVRIALKEAEAFADRLAAIGSTPAAPPAWVAELERLLAEATDGEWEVQSDHGGTSEQVRRIWANGSTHGPPLVTLDDD